VASKTCEEFAKLEPDQNILVKYATDYLTLVKDIKESLATQIQRVNEEIPYQRTIYSAKKESEIQYIKIKEVCRELQGMRVFLQEKLNIPEQSSIQNQSSINNNLNLNERISTNFDLGEIRTMNASNHQSPNLNINENSEENNPLFMELFMKKEGEQPSDEDLAMVDISVDDPDELKLDDAELPKEPSTEESKQQMVSFLQFFQDMDTMQ